MSASRRSTALPATIICPAPRARTSCSATWATTISRARTATTSSTAKRATTRWREALARTGSSAASATTLYLLNDASDTIIEIFDEGTDEVRIASNYTLASNVEKLTLLGTGNLNGTGNGLDNTITGTSGNNVIDGGAGADLMIGGAGDDTYYIDSAGDSVREDAGGGTDTAYSAGSWVMGANVENLTLTGSANVNAIGNALGNVITGNSGNNVLEGGAGVDQLIGGAGNDTYVWDGVDTIVELSAAAPTRSRSISRTRWRLPRSRTYACSATRLSISRATLRTTTSTATTPTTYSTAGWATTGWKVSTATTPTTSTPAAIR